MSNRARTRGRKLIRLTGLPRAFVTAWVFAGSANMLHAQEAEQDLLLFTSVGRQNFAEASSDVFPSFDVTPTVDVIYSRARGRFRMFGEALFTDDEQEIERFQAGWQLSEDSRVWLGRFHHSGSYWNTEFHHGQYLQTSLTRPAIEEFEDHGGILPLHMTGVMLEQREEFFWGSALQLSLSAGLSGRFGDDELHAFDLLNPGSGFEPAVNARIAYFPDALGENQIGLALGAHNIVVDQSSMLQRLWDPDTNEIEMETTGVYVDWRWPHWRLIGSVLRVSPSGVGGTDTTNHDFTSSYAQAEWANESKWTYYGRLEYTSGDDAYLNLFPAYVRQQSVFGVRWEFARQHALTIEGTTSQARDDHFHRFSIQWSAVFP